MTENTEINTMRWNSKFEEKMFRYDAKLYKGRLEPLESYVICNESNFNKNDNDYEVSILPKLPKDLDVNLRNQIKKIKTINMNYLFQTILVFTLNLIYHNIIL